MATRTNKKLVLSVVQYLAILILNVSINSNLKVSAYNSKCVGELHVILKTKYI